MPREKSSEGMPLHWSREREIAAGFLPPDNVPTSRWSSAFAVLIVVIALAVSFQFCVDAIRLIRTGDDDGAAIHLLAAFAVMAALVGRGWRSRRARP